jgi:uncharacterized protein (DUF924 family)
MTTPQDVLEFWFGAEASAGTGAPRDLWFGKSDETDATIRSRFGADVEAALAGGRDDWAREPRGAVALLLLLDQFTRNIFRDTPRAFAGDARALALARSLVERGDDRLLAPLERWFVYLPFEHDETLASQQEALRLFGQLEAEGHPSALEWAEKHYDVIARFGRFPHRNAILGRTSTPEEVEFLRQPGSRF